MNTKLILITLILTGSSYNLHAQLLDKLKERTKEKGLKTQEVSYDKDANEANKNSSSEGEEMLINSAKDFYNTDVIMKLYYETNNIIHTQYFDADVIAMRTELPDPTKKPLFHDSKGFIYAYNEKIGSYEKSKLLSSGGIGFMTANMIPQAYKLPPEPYLDAFGKLQEKDITLNFLVLEMAFIYKPGHFEDDSHYTVSKTKCNSSNNCTKFIYNDPEYPGSYILFDDQKRLSKLYVNTIRTDVKKEDHPIGEFVYLYKECNVKLPDAIEQSMIPGPFGKMLNLERGLEPWKHNKKDNQKN